MVLNKQPDNRRQRVSKIVQLPGAAQSNPLDELAEIASEEAVIGAVLQNPDLYPTLADMLEPGDFCYLWHGYVWHAMERLMTRGDGIDIVTVDTELEYLGQANTERLAGLVTAAPNHENAETYAKRVRDAATILRLEQAATDIKALIRDKTTRGFIDAVVDQVNALIYAATDQRPLTDSSIAAAVNLMFDRIDAADGKPRTLSTGFKRFDELSGAFAPGEVTILAGNDGMGKTTMALSMIRSVAKSGGRVAKFALEMSQQEVVSSLIAMESGLSKARLRALTLNEQELVRFAEVAAVVAKWPLHIIDEFPDLNPLQLRRRLRSMLVREPIDLVVIDGLWLMSAVSPTPNRYEDVGLIMRELTKQAREFSVPIVITHQYNKDAHGRGRNDKTPITADLAESAAVRRTAQNIWALYRPSYYGIEDDLDLTRLYCLKNRNGTFVRDFTNFKFNANYARYEEA